jgi:hypothetical protein
MRKPSLVAFDDWKWGGPEPQISLHGKAFPVSAIAKFVSIFNDPMPDGLYDFLCRVIGTGNTPTVRTFAAGGSSLYRSCMDLQRPRARRSTHRHSPASARSLATRLARAQRRNERSPVVIGRGNGHAVKVARAGVAIKGQAAVIH